MSYFISGPTCISFSGGRTSAYMLHRTLAANGGLPSDAKVIFANTGREMPETLDFVQECAERWDVEITWLERRTRRAPENHDTKYLYETTVVDYDTASRNGEPFRELVMARRYAPNPVARYCTRELKISAIRSYLGSIDFPIPFTSFIGIRADEERRAAKMHGTIESGQERYLPLWLEGITKEDIYAFWKRQPFDLQLPNNRGTTDWGNCDLCFLKGAGKKLAIIRERPDLADWWIETEAMLSEEVGKGAYFRRDHPSYADMKMIATSQDSFDFGVDESIPCFCGE